MHKKNKNNNKKETIVQILPQKRYKKNPQCNFIYFKHISCHVLLRTDEPQTNLYRSNASKKSPLHFMKPELFIHFNMKKSCVNFFSYIDEQKKKLQELKFSIKINGYVLKAILTF